jgi:peroxiredoxin Q/BCP
VPLWVLGLAAATLVIGIAVVNTLRGPSAAPPDYAVGQPGVGQEAPDFALPTADGGMFRLSGQRGKMTLLFFHEGLGCAPCWQQVIDLQHDLSSFRALGVGEIVPISVDPLTAQAQHARQNGVTLPVLADENRSISRSYGALSYGMMGGMLPGHTFVLVGPDGSILWRADYGGPPNFTMYVPDNTLLAELQRVINPRA